MLVGVLYRNLTGCHRKQGSIDRSTMKKLLTFLTLDGRYIFITRLLVFINTVIAVGPVSANIRLVTSLPYAYRDRDFMLTCKFGNSQISNYFTWGRNDVSITTVQLSDCNTAKAPGSGPDLYSIYRYNCSLNTKDYNLIIPASRIANEEGSRWSCDDLGGAATSNTYTIKFYSAPTTGPSVTGYDGSPRFTGNTVTLTCKVDGGTPLATLSWTCKGSSVQSTNANTATSAIRTYTVTIDTSYNGQLCQCTASHPQWTEDRTINSSTIIVQYPPTENPVVSGYDGSVRYKGDTVTLTCQVSGGSPLATLSWTCNGQPQVVNTSVSGTTVTSVLTLTLQKGHNGKTCTCHGRHSYPGYTPNISSRTFIVYYPPSAPGVYMSTSTPFPWIEAGQGTLNCTSQPGNPPTITYQWIRENVVIPGQTGDSLVITSLTRNDNRKSYKCKVSNNYTVHKHEDLMSQPTVLDVEYRPVISIGKSPAYVNETDSFERTCTADGNPTPYISWTSNISRSNGAILRLVNIMRNQTGLYTCIAKAQSKGSHGLLSNQTVLNIIVQYPPSVQAILSPSNIKQGQDVTMTCLAKGVPDQYVYNGWTQIYRNKIIRSSNDFFTSSANKKNLTLSGVSYEDIGTYRCSANNGIPDKYGNQNQIDEKDLDIKFSAVFNSSGTFYSELNRTVEIRIPFISNPPVVVANISLMKDNIDQISTGILVAVQNRNLDMNFYGKDINVNGQEVVVTLHSFSSKLQGNYTIGVTNFQGGSLSTFVFEVIPSGPPESPKNFGILSKTSTSIKVTWLRGFNGGHEQTFVVLYKQKDGNENLLSEEIMEEKNRENYTLVIKNLMPQTEYDFWIYSYNKKGNDSTDFTSVSPVSIKTEGSQSGNIGAIVGGVMGTLVAIIILVVIGGVIFYRRRTQGTKRNDSRKNGKFPLTAREQSDEEDGMCDNVLYEPAGPNFVRPGTSNGASGANDYPYAEVQKNGKSGLDNPVPVYAEVQKNPKTEKKPDLSALYADVHKPKKEDKEGKGGAKPKKLLGKPKEKKSKPAKKVAEDGTLYENMDDINAQKKDDEKKKPKALKTKTKSNKNKDGLIYADILHESKPNGESRLVIHGLENKTDYAEVDFSRSGKPLPPDYSQTDKEEPANK